MKKLAILGPGVVGGSCAEILLRDVSLLERSAGEQLGYPPTEFFTG